MEMIDKIKVYELLIREVLCRFQVTYGDQNPIWLWRQGRIERTGTLCGDTPFEYALHGFGCTASQGDVVVSFDFDGMGSFRYAAFKFCLFVGEDYKTDGVAVEFERVISNGKLVTIPGRGVGLSNIAYDATLASR